uniref:Serine/threonine-protein phosphatase n=1 Tax=Caldicellulosiruptor owensensis TaxID=55205 RepID=A0A7C5Z354_9FIRM
MVRVIYFTNKGNLRDTNQDSLLVCEKIISNTDMNKCESLNIDSKSILLAVADGIGGNTKGELASKKVLEVLQSHKEDIMNKKISIEDVLKKARDELENYVHSNPNSSGMGCTVAGVFIVDRKVQIFNVGDCRIYRLLGPRAVKLTKDHTVVEELVSSGYITVDEAKTHSKKHILTSAIVADNYQTEIQIYRNETEIIDKDKFIICSDGFWEEFENEISQIFSNDNFYPEFQKRIQNKKLNDNISFILITQLLG